MISSKPDVLTYPLSEHEVDYMLFLSTDGVWDSLKDEEIYEAIRLFITEHPIKGLFFAVCSPYKRGNSQSLSLLRYILQVYAFFTELFSITFVIIFLFYSLLNPI